MVRETAVENELTDDMLSLSCKVLCQVHILLRERKVANSYRQFCLSSVRCLEHGHTARI